MKIETNKFVSLIYDLNVGEGEELELMERATPDHPLEFIYGTNSMIDAFEKNLDGLSDGDSFEFSIQPEEAYGEYVDENVVELPKSIFEVDGKIDEQVIYPNAMVPMMDSEGNRLNGSVVEIKDDSIIMDFNHPYAGETLHFKGKILSVRDASAEEIAALFAPQSGCGCGSCDCGDEEGNHGGGCGSGCNC